MLPHSLNILEVQRYGQDEPKFNTAYSRVNFPVAPTRAAKVKNGKLVKNFDDYGKVGTH